MVQRCCVPLCGTKVGDRDINGTKVRFHRIPTTQERFSNWQDKITDSHRFRPILSINSRVCSKHFHKEDYIVKPTVTTSNSNVSSSSGVNFGGPLDKDAVPTRFKWNVDNCDISAPSSSNINFITVSTAPSSPLSVSNNENVSRTPSAMDVQDFQEEIEVNSEIINSENNSQEANQVNSEGGRNVCININQGTQCVLEDEKVKSEVHRKNTIIKQLLTKITDLEEEQKLMDEAIAELRAANESFDNQIQELNKKNKQLEDYCKTLNRLDKFEKDQKSRLNEGRARERSQDRFDLDNDHEYDYEPTRGKRARTSIDRGGDDTSLK